MAQIFDAATGLRVDTTPGAARGILYDAAGNVISRTDGQTLAAGQGGVPIMGVNGAQARFLRVDRLGSMQLGAMNFLLADSFNQATVNTVRYLQTLASGTNTQSSSTGNVLTGTVAASQGAMLQSARKIWKVNKAPLLLKARAKLTSVTNSVVELGFSDAAGVTTAATWGVYFQVTSAGVLQPVVTLNGVDTTGSAISFVNTNYYIFDILLDDESVTFTVQDSSTGALVSQQTMYLPLTALSFSRAANGLMYHSRVYNTGSAPASAPTLTVTDLAVGILDFSNNKPYAYMAAGMERGFTASMAGAQLAAWTNSAEPASATLSNTAAGYTTLGGKFQFAAVAGAVTDFALFGFTVPNFGNLYVTGIDIETWNTVVPVATTPTLLTWAAAAGSTAVSLATTTAMRVGLGAQSFAIGAVAGATAQRISKSFNTPIFCASGRFFHIILRVPVGTATATEVFAGMVNVEGFFA